MWGTQWQNGLRAQVIWGQTGRQQGPRCTRWEPASAREPSIPAREAGREGLACAGPGGQVAGLREVSQWRQGWPWAQNLLTLKGK